MFRRSYVDDKDSISGDPDNTEEPLHELIEGRSEYFIVWQTDFYNTVRNRRFQQEYEKPPGINKAGL